jgi:tetratricopeptide (TPR) repeat protein
MKYARCILLIALFALSMTAHAQEATPEVVALVEPLPASARLDGLTLVWQDVNRCSAAALSIQISYFGPYVYDAAVRYLNPNLEDVATRFDEMIAFAEQYGLRGVGRIGGTLDMLKALVAHGFPVLIENSYFDGAGGFRDWMGHNRVVMGYDDAQQVLLTYDPLLGAGENQIGRPIPYADIDERWRPFNRDYLVLYRPEDEARLMAVLGDHWDILHNAEWALSLSQAELDSGTYDSFTLFNMGSALAALERYAEAADAFDQARANGLPWRMFWYQYGAFEAYYQLERYDDMITLAQEVIATTGGVEEAYYYIGMAAEGLGDFSRAANNYEAAVWRNENFTAAAEALARVRG